MNPELQEQTDQLARVIERLRIDMISACDMHLLFLIIITGLLVAQIVIMVVKRSKE